MSATHPPVPLADALRGAPGVLEDLDRWLREDLGRGDVTSVLTVPAGLRVLGQVLVKSPGVLAGLPVMEAVLRRLDPELEWEPRAEDGREIAAGHLPFEAARMRGEARAILAGERLALNLAQRLSGIATAARRAGSRATSKNASPRVRSTWRSSAESSIRILLAVFKRTLDPSCSGTDAIPPTGVA